LGGPQVLQTPPDVPEEIASEFEEVRAWLQARVTEQDEVAVWHYQRLVREGRLPAPDRAREALEDMPELEREERQVLAEKEQRVQTEEGKREEERCRREAMAWMVPPVVWDELLAAGDTCIRIHACTNTSRPFVPGYPLIPIPHE
jgi:hypothetical protein